MLNREDLERLEALKRDLNFDKYIISQLDLASKAVGMVASSVPQEHKIAFINSVRLQINTTVAENLDRK